MRSNPLARSRRTRGEIIVVGSCNADLIVSGGVIPSPGQTVRADRLTRAAGGKGLNQAVAAARAGGKVRMLASVGADSEGDDIRSVLEGSGIDCTLVRRASTPTGSAVVTVSRDSDNAISIISGANAMFASLTPDESAALHAAAIVLLQLELPLPLVMAAASIAHEGGALVVLTPAPVVPLPTELLTSVDLLLVNRHEALSIAGSTDLDDALEALVSSVPVVVVTDGSRGCQWATADGERGAMPARSVEAVDTTGAGDTFAGYLVVGLLDGCTLEASIARAVAAASLSVQRSGGSPSIPIAEEVDVL